MDVPFSSQGSLLQGGNATAIFLVGLSSFLFGVACIGLSWALGTKILKDNDDYKNSLNITTTTTPPLITGYYSSIVCHDMSYRTTTVTGHFYNILHFLARGTARFGSPSCRQFGLSDTTGISYRD